MEVLRRVGGVVGMNSGEAGETSYSNNSDFQRMIACVTKERQDMVAALYRVPRPAAAMAIAYLGCSTGPNALLTASDAVQAVLSECARLAASEEAPPEFHVFLNDLPTNDFNSVFHLLPEAHDVAAAGALLRFDVAGIVDESLLILRNKYRGHIKITQEETEITTILLYSCIE